MLEKTTEMTTTTVCYMDIYQPRAIDGVGGGAVVKMGTSWNSLIQAPFHGDCALLGLFGLSPATLIPPAVQKHAHHGDI